MHLAATSHPRSSLLGKCSGSPLGFSSLRRMIWNRFLLNMNNSQDAILRKQRILCDLNENQSILLSFKIIARHVLVSSHEVVAIIILTGCYVVTVSSRFGGELQNLAKKPAKLAQIRSWISNPRKAQYWQVHFLNINAVELKIEM